MDEVWGLAAMLSLVAGGAGYYFAKRTGRSPALWVAIGILLNVAGLALIGLAARRRGSN